MPEQHGKVDIIDVGSRPSYWNIFSKSIFHDLNISLLFINGANEIAVDKIDQEQNHASNS